MKRIIKIIILLLGIAQGNVFSQGTLANLSTIIPVKSTPGTFAFSKASGVSTFSGSDNIPGNTQKSNFYALQRMILPDYHTASFGFFCKKELQLEKATKIPLRFRLGSLDYCDKLEGKQSSNRLFN